MIKRLLTYSVIAVLTIVLIGGTISILVRPNDVEARGVPGVNRESGEGGNGNNGGNGEGNGESGNSGTSIGGRGTGNEENINSGRGRGQESSKYAAPINWDTVTGVVVISDSELTVSTNSGELLVGMGQSWYREDQDFVVNVGDEVRILGYEEDGEFKAGTIENLTTGASIVLRDTSGRPMWSGQNARNSDGSGQSTQIENRGGYGSSSGRGQGQSNGGDAGELVIPELVNTEALPCLICDTADNYDGPLSEAELKALYLALNDEYHAWAVYNQVILDFGGVRPFTSIQNAESSHISALTRLFEQYDIPLPENSWIGQTESFENLGDACSAGVQAEIANGALYDTLFSSTVRADILNVYTSLQRASLDKHLPAFSRCAD